MFNKIIPFLILVFASGILISQDNPFYAPGDPERVSTHSQSSYLDTNLVVQGVWSRVGNLPKSLLGVNSYYDSLTNKIFICGGLDQNSVPNDTCWWYDIASNTYQQAAFLPQGRWSGKLVKVKSSLYLIGSIDSTFSTADGIIYKYSLQQNTWTAAGTMPLPYVHESAVCVLRDSLIAVIGGSTNGFSNPKNYVRLYDPELNTWRTLTSFPINITTAHSELSISTSDTSIFVAGGYNAGNLNTLYRGSVSTQNDTLEITWLLFGNTPFPTGVYRVAGTKWKDYMLFGPALNIGISLNNIWGLIYRDSFAVWTAFTPVSNDTAGNISTFASVTGLDSNYFYLFGGYKNPNVLNIAQKYSFITPPPIGIIHNTNVSKDFRLSQNYPNPFNPVTKIRFDIPQGVRSISKSVILLIYDILGKKIAKYEYYGLKSGSYEIEFDGKNLASGIYFYTIVSGNFSQTMKMMLIK